jgi:rhamnose transport system substrate-binding protein
MKIGKTGAVACLAGTVALIAATTASASPTAALRRHAASAQYSIAFVPKLIGIPYFTAMQQGMIAASKRFGGKFIYEGPTTASVSGQDEYVKTLIAQHVSAVGVSANSATSPCPLYAQAVKAHIVTYASDSDVSCPTNELWVEQATSQAIGFAAVDILASEIHGSGDVAIVSAGSTATNLNAWIGYMKARLKRYPRLHLVSVQYAGESISGSDQIASRLIAAYPNLKGMIGVASTNVPGLAEAVQEAGKVGKIAVTGETDPNTIRPAIESGVVKAVVLWNPTYLGYLTYWGVLQLLEHHPLKAENVVPGLPGKYAYYAKTKTLLLGPPLIITKKNVNLNF